MSEWGGSDSEGRRECDLRNEKRQTGKEKREKGKGRCGRPRGGESYFSMYVF